jgi:hypothetical protein
MSQIPVQKTVYTRDSFSKVVNTEFNQLIQTTEGETPTFREIHFNRSHLI